MDSNTLAYYTGLLVGDCNNFMTSIDVPEGVSDQDFRRALNAGLDSIRADVANLQYLIDG